MRHRLLAVTATVEHRTVTIGQAFLLCNEFCSQEEVTHQKVIACFEVVERGDWFSGDHQEMGRCYRIDVAYRKTHIILIYKLGRDIPVGYFLK